MAIETAWVMGGGPTGVNLAEALAIAGLKVTVIEADPDAAERARFMLSTKPGSVLVMQGVAEGQVDLVFDALDADSHERRALFERIACSLSNTVFATTSDPDAVNRDLPPEYRGRMIGFHVSQPFHLRRLVEMVATETATAAGVSQLFDLACAMGKTAVRVKPGRASIATRLHRCMSNICDSLLMQGAIVHELDEAMVAFGFNIGFFEAEDLTGLDVAFADRGGSDTIQTPIADRMVQEGRLGRKVGVGWYRYPGGEGAVVDPLIEDLVREEAWFANVPQREIHGDEILCAILMALRTEGLMMLKDCTADAESDIDLVASLALGYPAMRGSLMSEPGYERWP